MSEETTPSQWVPKWGGIHAFQAILELQLKYPHNNSNLLKAGANGLGCLRCSTATPLPPCKNCGNETYKLGVNPAGQVGLFCASCRQGFATWTCDCGCENPVTNETLLVKVVPSKGGCFVATAAYGDATALEVIYLSAFRDHVLTSYGAGRTFIRAYYATSPSLARLIAKSPTLKSIARVALLRPVIFILRILRNEKRA